MIKSAVKADERQSAPSSPICVLVVEPDAARQLRYVLAAQEVRANIEFRFVDSIEVGVAVGEPGQWTASPVDLVVVIEDESNAGDRQPKPTEAKEQPVVLYRRNPQTFADLMMFVGELDGHTRRAAWAANSSGQSVRS